MFQNRFIRSARWTVLPVLLALSTAGNTAAAQELPPQASEKDSNDMIEGGIQLLMQGILGKVAPHLDGMADDMGDAMQLLGPALGDLSHLIDDIGNYERPEMLESGDILIRRKAGAPAPPEIGEGLLQLLPPELRPRHRDHDQPKALPDDDTLIDL